MFPLDISAIGGRGTRTMMNKWFNSSSVQELVLATPKSYTMKDIIRLAKIKGTDKSKCS